MKIPRTKVAFAALLEAQRNEAYQKGRNDGRWNADVDLKRKASEARIKALASASQAMDAIAHLVAEMRE